MYYECEPPRLVRGSVDLYHSRGALWLPAAPLLAQAARRVWKQSEEAQGRGSAKSGPAWPDEDYHCPAARSRGATPYVCPAVRRPRRAAPRPPSGPPLLDRYITRQARGHQAGAEAERDSTKKKRRALRLVFEPRTTPYWPRLPSGHQQRHQPSSPLSNPHTAGPISARGVTRSWTSLGDAGSSRALRGWSWWGGPDALAVVTASCHPAARCPDRAQRRPTPPRTSNAPSRRPRPASHETPLRNPTRALPRPYRVYTETHLNTAAAPPHVSGTTCCRHSDSSYPSGKASGATPRAARSHAAWSAPAPPRPAGRNRGDDTADDVYDVSATQRRDPLGPACHRAG